MIRIYRNLRKFRNQFQGLAEYILRRNIFRVVIICIERKNTTLHSIHDIGIGSLHNYITDKTTTQIFHIKHYIQESGKFILIRKLPKNQKIDSFFKAKTSALQAADDILYVNSLIV